MSGVNSVFLEAQKYMTGQLSLTPLSREITMRRLLDAQARVAVLMAAVDQVLENPAPANWDALKQFQQYAKEDIV